jgi:hypothetical protein
MGAQARGLPSIDCEGQFEQKRRRLLFGGALGCGCFLLLMSRTCFYI